VLTFQLAMLTLGTTFAGSYLALSGGEKPAAPPIKASSDDEEKFIR
jgi:F-type H+-transporting ATPase subunit k